MSDYDVVVIGSGLAGLSAAVEANDSGASVLVLEAENQIGGSSRLSSCIFMAANTPLQRKHGIQDHPDDLFRDYVLANRYDVNIAAVRRLADDAGDAIEWLAEHGVEFDEKLYLTGVETVPRGHAAIGEGEAVIQALHAHLRQSSTVDIALGNRAEHLHTTDGRVTGVEVDGDTVAAGAVVISTGGFGANVELLKKHYPAALRSGEWSWHLGAPGARGDAFRFADEVGAQITGFNRGSLATRPNFSRNLEPYLPGWLIIVNAQGRRFFDERSPYSVTKCIVGAQDWPIHAVWDAAAQQAAQPASTFASKKVNLPGFTTTDWVEPVLEEMEAEGKVVKADTLRDLATKLGIPSNNLEGTITRYNRDIEKGLDSMFLKDPTTMRPVSTPPFFATELRQPQISLTAVGPAVDPDARVVDGGTLPVPGLFAAGECVGGILGEMYVGSGNSVTNCLVFGRIAGRNAADEAAQLRD